MMASYAYYALHKLHIRLKDFYEMSREEQIATIAFIRLRREKEEEEFKKLRR